MLPAQSAETLILDLVHPLDPQRDRESVHLLSAHGRILATAVTGQLDIPHWDNSAMDGYAVRYADVQSASPEHPVGLAIVEEIPAGYQPQRTIQPGQTARILTGSMMPAGADTVVIQEEVQRQGDRITLSTAPQPHAFVRHRAAFYQAGTPLLAAGIILGAADIAVLATAQSVQVPVYRRPRVAIFSTGSELVSPDQPLQPGQIVDSNQYALAALVASSGAEPILLGRVPDDAAALSQAIQSVLQPNGSPVVDMIISSGGVSVGDYDYVDTVLAELGATLHVRAVAIKPGKPLTVATLPGGQGEAPLLYFGLPGNPVSALVTFWRFVQPALRKLSGLAQGWSPTVMQGLTAQDLCSDGKRETYLWGRAELVEGHYLFHLAGGSHSSGNLINLAQTNALAVIPVGQRGVAAGDPMQIMWVQS